MPNRYHIDFLRSVDVSIRMSEDQNRMYFWLFYKNPNITTKERFAARNLREYSEVPQAVIQAWVNNQVELDD